DMGAVERDVKRLYQVLEEGLPGKMETKIIDVIVKANVNHLREVIRWYKHQHGKDVSKLVLKHSKNLVVSRSFYCIVRRFKYLIGKSRVNRLCISSRALSISSCATQSLSRMRWKALWPRRIC